MTDLTQQIARLEKLDAERTPGRMRKSAYSSSGNIHLDADGITIAKVVDCEKQRANADFLEAAPELMAVTRVLWPRYQEQQRLLGLAVEAGKTIRDYAALACKRNNDDHIPGNSVKAHKMLMALAGVNEGYESELDAAFTTLAQLKTQEEL